MAALRQCDSFVLRYVPNAANDEFVNIGVVLMEQGDGEFADVRFRRDWRRVLCAHPDADLELLQAYEQELRRLLQSREPETINYRGPMSRREWFREQMEKSFSGALQLAPAKAVQTDAPQAELGRLATQYLESPVRGSRVQTGRRVVYQAMREAFEGAGVWPFLRKDIAVAQYTRKGDPLKIDCGYRPNGTVHLFHALSLATDVNSAKVLAFSYSEMRDGFMNAEHALSELTVITENELDEDDEGVAFALATLRDNEIGVARLAAMPQIAERARYELKL